MRFRLAQYLEVNFVEANVVYEQRLEHESLDNVYPNDIHVVAGSVDEGEILCYATLKSAPDAPPGTTLRTRDRPLLPVEKTHGFGIFNRLPILPDLPVAADPRARPVRQEPALPRRRGPVGPRPGRGRRRDLPDGRRDALVRAVRRRRRPRGGGREAEPRLLPDPARRRARDDAGRERGLVALPALPAAQREPVRAARERRGDGPAAARRDRALPLPPRQARTAVADAAAKRRGRRRGAVEPRAAKGASRSSRTCSCRRSRWRWPSAARCATRASGCGRRRSSRGSRTRRRRRCRPSSKGWRSRRER